MFKYSIRFSEEDVLGNYSRVMIKYFLAEGVACKHALLVASGEENPRNIVSYLVSKINPAYLCNFSSISKKIVRYFEKKNTFYVILMFIN